MWNLCSCLVSITAFLHPYIPDDSIAFLFMLFVLSLCTLVLHAFCFLFKLHRIMSLLPIEWKKRENLTTGIRLIRWTKLTTTQAYAMEKCNKKSLSSVVSTACYVLPQAYVYLQICRTSLTVLFPFLFDSMALIVTWCLFSINPTKQTNRYLGGDCQSYFWIWIIYMYVCVCIISAYIHLFI